MGGEIIQVWELKPGSLLFVFSLAQKLLLPPPPSFAPLLLPVSPSPPSLFPVPLLISSCPCVQESVRWMVNNFRCGTNCILGDEASGDARVRACV